MKLTKRIVDQAAPEPDRDAFIWCSELTGFGLKITPAGAKIYVIAYRTTAGQRRRLTIGKHLQPWTCDQARTRAFEVLREAALGGDPLEEKATDKAALTVEQLCDRYLTACEQGLILGKGGRPKKVSTLATDRGRIKRHILPLLGKKKVKDLTATDVTRFLRSVAVGETAGRAKTEKLRGVAIVEGGRGTATRTTGLLGGILSFALSEGIIERNPVHGVKRPADGRRLVRLDAAEYGRFGRALMAIEEAGASWQAVACLWLLALTGCRRGEIQKLKWSEVDLEGHCLRLSDSKEGASIRPLGLPALEILASIEKRDGFPFVLPAIRGSGAFDGLTRPWAEVVRNADLPSFTPHGLRHAFASVAADLEYSEPTIAALLGHTSGGVTRRYIHKLDSALIAAADRVADRIRGFMIAL